MIKRFALNKARAKLPYITLTYMTPFDIFRFLRWFKDEELTRLAFGVRELNEYTISMVNTFKLMFFTRYLNFRSIRYKGQTVGFVYLSTGIRGNASLGIVLGRAYWNKGLGTAALMKTLELLFEKKGIKRLTVDTATFNLRAKKMFENLGFKTLGVDERRGKVFFEMDRGTYLELVRRLREGRERGENLSERDQRGNREAIEATDDRTEDSHEADVLATGETR